MSQFLFDNTLAVLTYRTTWIPVRQPPEPSTGLADFDDESNLKTLDKIKYKRIGDKHPNTKSIIKTKSPQQNFEQKFDVTSFGIKS